MNVATNVTDDGRFVEKINRKINKLEGRVFFFSTHSKTQNFYFSGRDWGRGGCSQEYKDASLPVVQCGRGPIF